MPIPVESFLSEFEKQAREKFEKVLEVAEKRFPKYIRESLPKIGSLTSLNEVSVDARAELSLDAPELRDICNISCKEKGLKNCSDGCSEAGRVVMDLTPGGWVRYISITIPRDKDLEEFADLAFSGICQEHAVEPITRYFSIVRGEGCRLETVASVVEQIRRWE